MTFAANKPDHVYNQNNKARARDLRKNSTLGEIILWGKLKGRQLFDYKFIRQKQFGNYIVDLYCHELRLVIEVDGFSHDFKMEYDKERQRYLEEGCGVTVLRFKESDVRKNIDQIIQWIVDWIHDNRRPVR